MKVRTPSKIESVSLGFGIIAIFAAVGVFSLVAVAIGFSQMA